MSVNMTAMRMTRLTTTLAIVFGTFVSLSPFGATHARGVASPARQDSALPDAPGRAVVEKVCTTCHGLDYLVPSERTAPVWRDTIDLMRGYGAEATDEQWKTITDYIIANLAHLSVSKATPEDIGLVLGVDEKIAQGVVAYRDKQGGFKTIEDLKKAPDLEPAKVDALKARLIFE
ncbi:MAG: helix-hairpin-helix domain-containing protein [Acidobacteria bacterium]|nr:helix-hairpin-helix domain-containing protein [Acidobacteriota bacterium]